MVVVRKLPSPAAGVRLADAVEIFSSTITVTNTRRGYVATLGPLVAAFGADTAVAGLDPAQVSGWFVHAWLRLATGCSGRLLGGTGVDGDREL
jgi:hypothetical protein